MKKDIHPQYREVVFQDTSSDFKFLTRSTMSSNETITWEDGKTYPVIKIEVSSASHPFYTGKNVFIDTAGRQRITFFDIEGLNQLTVGVSALQVGNTFAILAQPNFAGTPQNVPIDLSGFVQPAFVAAPNPFNPSTSIRFELSSEAQVRLTVYDASGARVTTLYEGRMSSGAHAVRWNGTDSGGERVGSGVYFCRLEAGGETMTRKLVLLK